VCSSDLVRRVYFKANQLDGQYNESNRADDIREYKDQSFLSKVGYYECLVKE